MASADLMIETIRGKTIKEAEELREKFKKMILSGEDFKNEDSMKDLGVSLALGIVARMPARAKCAELAWQIFDVKKEDTEYL